MRINQRNSNTFLFAICVVVANLSLQRLAQADISVSTNTGWTPYFLEQELIPPEKGTSFLTSIAISQGHVATLTQTDFTTDGTGVVHLLDFEGSGPWTETAYANVGVGTNSGGADETHCFSIGIDGDNVVVGQPYFTIIPYYQNQGGAIFFRHRDEGWVFAGILTDPDPSEGQFFGCKVAISGNVAVIGMPYASGIGGAAFVANFDGTNWALRQKLSVSSGPHSFGSAVAISGEHIVIGAAGFLEKPGDIQNAAYVFTRTGDRWNQTAMLLSPDGERGDEYASSIAIDDDTIAIGASGKNATAGAVYIYRNVGSGWALQRELQRAPFAGRARQFGAAVALHSGRLVIGEPGMATAHLFERTDDDWVSRSTFVSDDMDSNFGWLVGTFDREVIVGTAHSTVTYVFRDDEIFADRFQR